MSQKEFEQLTLKDRLNVPYLLAKQVLTFQAALLALEYSDKEIRESIKGFVHMIPSSWKDEQFRKDMKEAEITVKVDIRPESCGIKASEEFCKLHGIEQYKEELSRDYYKVFQACIDLLNRRGMMGKINRVEELEGIDFDAVSDDEVCESEIQSEQE